MARISKSQYFDIITNFPWSNLNKEITGDVLRQFIVNILDSVPEMTLIDGKTIEQAIQELRNRTGGGDGTSVDFSDQFKVINSVVFMDVSLITANVEEEPAPEPEPDPDPVPVFEIVPEPGLDGDYLLQKNVDWLDSQLVDVSNDFRILFYPTQNIYRVEFINRFYMPANIFDPEASEFSFYYPYFVKINTNKLGFPLLFLPQRYFVRLSLRVNQSMFDARVGSAGFSFHNNQLVWFKKAIPGVSSNKWIYPVGTSGGAEGLEWGEQTTSFDWYYDTENMGNLQVPFPMQRKTSQFIEAGSYIEFYNLRIEQ